MGKNMKNFNIKQKHSKFLIMIKDLLTVVIGILTITSFIYSVMFAIFWPNEWMIIHWYFGIAGWLIVAFVALILIFMVFATIIHLIYMYLEYLSFRAYLPLTMDDLKNNHVKNQSDLIHFLVMYHNRYRKFLGEWKYAMYYPFNCASYNFSFEYSEKDIDILKDCFSQLPPANIMSDEFKIYYEEYFKDYFAENDIDSLNEEIVSFISLFYEKKENNN